MTAVIILGIIGILLALPILAKLGILYMLYFHFMMQSPIIFRVGRRSQQPHSKKRGIGFGMVPEMPSPDEAATTAKKGNR